MVEFALVAPVLLMLLLGILQFGLLFNNWIEVTNAARDGARKGAVSRTSNTGVADAIAAARASAGSLNVSNMSITVSPSQPWVAGQDIVIQVSYPGSVSILGIVVWSGRITSKSTVRME
jgi:Flp pilus assembly protein TadG